MVGVGAMQRRKGAGGEREAAKEIVRLFAEHGIEGKASRTAPLQAGAVRDLIPDDVAMADITVDLLPDDHAEVKRQERIEIEKWCKQAEAECGKRKPLVIWRRNRQPWRVTLPLAAYVAREAELRDLRTRLDAAESKLWQLGIVHEDH